MASETLATGVRPFAPRFALWSDGATKRRWAYLPPCSQIDTTEPDYWKYPIGTKLWKEFTREDANGNPVRVETRLIQKRTKTKWFMAAFVWNDEGTDALRVAGDDPSISVALENAKGTNHDVPGQKSCDGCHYQMADFALGFSAVQLDHTAEVGDWNLNALIDEGWLTEPPVTPIELPGTEAQQAALGYIHANCGTCHNPYAEKGSLELQLWLTLADLDSVEQTQTYLTTVAKENQAPEKPEGEPLLRVVPRDPMNSALYWRMIQIPSWPGTDMGGTHMPRIGTEITDEVGTMLVTDWINSLDTVDLPEPSGTELPPPAPTN